MDRFYEDEYIVVTPEDDDCLRAVKKRLSGLPMAERSLFLMFLEEGTYSAVARKLRCSVPTVSKKIRAIKKKIKLNTEEICRDY